MGLSSYYENEAGVAEIPGNAAPVAASDTTPPLAAAAAEPKPSPARQNVGNIRTFESDDEDSDSDMVRFFENFTVTI